MSHSNVKNEGNKEQIIYCWKRTVAGFLSVSEGSGGLMMEVVNDCSLLIKQFFYYYFGITYWVALVHKQQ